MEYMFICVVSCCVDVIDASSTVLVEESLDDLDDTELNEVMYVYVYT